MFRREEIFTVGVNFRLEWEEFFIVDRRFGGGGSIWGVGFRVDGVEVEF